MTVEFFGFPKIGQTTTIDKSKTDSVGKSSSTNETSSSFTTALKGASVSQAESVTDSERAARVAELKSQVAEGTYEPDLDKVASSLLKFLVEG